MYRLVLGLLALCLTVASHSSFAQEYVFVEHKPTGKKMKTCEKQNGTEIFLDSPSFTGWCVQWEVVDNGEYFHLLNRNAQRFLTPQNSDNGSALVIQPNSWTGNWTQWRFVETGDGFGRLEHRYTGKFIFGDKNGVSLQPNSWTGDYTRWALVPVESKVTWTINLTGDASASLSYRDQTQILDQPGTYSIEVSGSESFFWSVTEVIGGSECAFANGSRQIASDALDSPVLDIRCEFIKPPFDGAKYEPEGDTVLIFTGQDNQSVGGNSVYNDGYIENVGSPAGITHYVYFTEGATNNFGFTFDVGTVDGLNAETTWGAGPMCMKCYVDSPEMAQMLMHLSISMEFNSEDRVAAGEFDHLIVELAQFLEAYDHFPFLIRIGYEFDGPWNNYDAVNFRNAFIRIVDGLRDAGVDNYATVMAASTMFVPRSTWDAFWPGDDYVDWVGYSYFGGSVDDNAPALQLAREKDKPVFIAEAAPRGNFLDSADGNGVWNGWFAPIFGHIENNTDVVKGFAYISADWDSQPMWRGQGWGDTRIEINSVISDNWDNKMAEDLYLHDPEPVYDLIRFEPAP